MKNSKLNVMMTNKLFLLINENVNMKGIQIWQ